MNELRMYVEQLFKGRVMDDDMIELKEEIYGNLVARYEDLLSQGVEEDEALTKAKASISSIDDVLGSEAGAMNAGSVAETASMPKVDTDACPDELVGDSRPSVATDKRIPWKWLVAAGLVLVALVGLGIWGAWKHEQAEDYRESIEEAEASRRPGRHGHADEGGRDELPAAPGTDTGAGSGGAAELKTYVGLDVSDADSLANFVRALPLCMDYADAAIASSDGKEIAVSLVDVPESMDEKTEDALVYDSVALFTVLPDVESVKYSVREAGDAPIDADTYTFTRAMVETRCQAFPADHVGGFEPSLLDDEGVWNAIRERCRDRRFVDELCDLAEQE